MNVSLTGILLGEWRDLTDDELIDLFAFGLKTLFRSEAESEAEGLAATPASSARW